MAAGKLGRGWLVAIGAFKLAKAVALVVIGALVIDLARGSEALETARAWFEALSLDPDGRWAHRALAALAGVGTKRLEEVGAGAFFYAAVFAGEGVGLLLGKRWAEIFTVVVTASFVPIEAVEALRKPTALRAGAILVNVAILAYLVLRIRRERAEARAG